MADYPETTLAEFKDRAARHAAGEKAGPTICFKGLNSRDRRTAIFWMREQHDAVRARIRIEGMHLRYSRDLLNLDARWSDLRIRLGGI